ncbi:MAG: GIY-YIG nuclease family protein [Flavobacteriales bacterium]|nr:GIY-YIG nuclease family protein [Flavobacteriales bacterium]
MKRGGSVYMMTNKRNGTIYTGVTSNLVVRTGQHRRCEDPNSFCSRYGLNKLVYYEHLSFIEEAIMREKQLKAGGRKKKIVLIESMNPNWFDLFDDLVKETEGL